MKTHNIKLPLSKAVVKTLHAGDIVYLSGVIYGARDQAHKRICEMIDQGKKLPFDLQNSCIYYFGPSPARAGMVIGSAGPTTAYRMDKLTLPLLDRGLLATIGKGNRGVEIKTAFAKYSAVYFAAIGGTGALISQAIIKNEIIAFPDLGTEAIRKLVVKDFKVIVAIDSYQKEVFK